MLNREKAEMLTRLHEFENQEIHNARIRMKG